LIDDALAAAGVQPRPFLALLRTYLTLDLRGQFYGEATNVAAGELVSPLYWVVGQFLTVSLLLSAVLQARVDAGFYAFAHLSVAALLVFSAVVVEFHEAAFDPADLEVVGHRPVTARTWSLARLTNLGLYVGLMTAALTLFPTFMGAALRDTGPAWLVVYPLASAAATTSAAAVALLLYTSTSFGAALGGVRRLAAWVQIVAILVLFYGGQLMLRDASGDLEVLAYAPPAWVRWLPTWWLGQGVGTAPDRVLLGLIAAAGLGGVALLRLSAAWASVTRVRPAQPVIEHRSERLVGPWVALAARSRREAAVLALALKAMARDGELRTRQLTTLALPATTVAIGLVTGEYGDPRGGLAPASTLPVVTSVLLAAAVPQALHQLTVSRDHRASWWLSRGWGPAERAGARKAVLAWVVAPLWLAHALLLVWLWGPVSAAWAAGFGWLLAELAGRLGARSLLARPILREPPRLGGSHGGSAMWVVGGVGAAVSVAGGAWALVASSPVGSVGLLVALIVACASVERAGR
jgi:hypothetical protein